MNHGPHPPPDASGRRFGSWLTIALAASALLCGGCGDSSSRTSTRRAGAAQVAALKKKQAEERDAAGKAQAAVQLQKAASKAAGKPARAAPPPPSVAARPAGPPKPPPRPEDFARWTAEDYSQAKKDRDPRLTGAIEHLAGSGRGGAEAIERLRTLLRRAEPGQARADGSLVRALVRGLATLESKQGNRTLEAILLDRFPTDDDPAASDEAVRWLADQPGPDSERIWLRCLKEDLNRVLTGPEGLRPQVRDRIFAGLASGASEEARLELARQLAGPPLPASHREACLRILMEPRPANLGAQLLLHQSAGVSKELRESLQTQFAAWSMAALGRLLWPAGDLSGGQGDRHIVQAEAARNTSQSPARGLSPAVGRIPDLPRHVAERLWRGDLPAEVVSRLDRLESLDQGARLLALAAAIPTDAVRAALYETLKRNWQDGPAGLPSGEALLAGPCEPGFLVVLKTLLRKSPGGAAARTVVTPRPSSPEGVRAWGNGRESERLRNEWCAYQGKLVFAICRALATGEGDRRAGIEESSRGESAGSRPDLPLEVHQDARVVVRCHRGWPADAAGVLGGFRPDPLEVWYVRIHQSTARYKAILAHYRRRMRSPVELPLVGGQGVWLAACGPGGDPSKRLSLDVLVYKAKPEAASVPNEEEKVTVEILAVEINEPARYAQLTQDSR